MPTARTTRRGRDGTKYVGLPTADYKTLADIAKANGMSIAHVARVAVGDWLVRNGHRERPRPLDLRKVAS